MPRATSSARNMHALVEKLQQEQAELKRELQAMRQKMSDAEAERAIARASLDLSRAVKIEQARMAEFWREAEKGPKTTIILSEPLALTLAGREVVFQAGKNVVPKAIVPLLEARLGDIAAAKQMLQALQLSEDDLPLPKDYVEEVLHS